MPTGGYPQAERYGVPFSAQRMQFCTPARTLIEWIGFCALKTAPPTETVSYTPVGTSSNVIGSASDGDAPASAVRSTTAVAALTGAPLCHLRSRIQESSSEYWSEVAPTAGNLAQADLHRNGRDGRMVLGDRRWASAVQRSEEWGPSREEERGIVVIWDDCYPSSWKRSDTAAPLQLAFPAAAMSRRNSRRATTSGRRGCCIPFTVFDGRRDARGRFAPPAEAPAPG